MDQFRIFDCLCLYQDESRNLLIRIAQSLKVSVFADIPKRRAASGSVSFSSDTNFTACSLNSAVNDCLGNFAISYLYHIVDPGFRTVI
jgi:hypothetical protein